MRNLKRVLSLALASAMLLGMMVIGAGAADKKAADLTDMDKVVNKEAVSLLVDLGIIAGKDDGTYAPTETVDRATMAKLVYYVLEGDANADIYKGSSNLKDVKGHWAEGFINYSYSIGIIAGDGTGNFLPATKVSTVGAAKMMLVALGYDPTDRGYVNDSQWSVNIMKDAQANGLLKGITQKAADELTRDSAALMIFNTLFAKTRTPEYDRDMGEKYIKSYTVNATTLGMETYGLVKYNITVDTLAPSVTVNSVSPATSDKTKPANFDAAAAKKAIENKDSGLKFTAGMVATNVAVYAKVDYELSSDSKAIDTMKFSKLYSTTVGSADTTVLGTSTNGTPITGYSTVAPVVDKDLTTKNSKNKGFIAELNKNATTSAVEVTSILNGVIEGSKGAVGTNTAAAAKLAGSIVELIDNGNDGVADMVKVTKQSAVTLTADVTTRTSDDELQVKVPGVPGLSAWTAAKNVTGYEGLKKDDVVLYFKTDDGVNDPTYTIAKAEMITGKPTATKGTAPEIKVDGTFYGPSGLVSNPLTGWSDFTNTYNFYLDTNGTIVKASKVTNEAADEFAVLVSTGWSGNASDLGATSYGQAKLLYSDGTTEIVKLAKINGTTVNSTNTTDATFNAIKGTFVKYVLNDDDQYELTTATATSKSTVNVANGAKEFTSGIIGSADTVFVVAVLDGTKTVYKTYTGISNVPTMKTVNVQALINKGIATTVFVDATGGTVEGIDADAQYVYIPDFTDFVKYAKDGDVPAYYDYVAYVDGTKGSVKMSAQVGTDNAVYKLTNKNTNGHYSVPAASGIFAMNNAAYKTGIVIANGGTLQVNGDSTIYGYGSESQIFSINTKKELTQIADSELKPDATNKIMVIADKDNFASIIFIQEIVGTTATATIKANVDNAGASAVTIGGTAPNFTGKVVAADKKTVAFTVAAADDATYTIDKTSLTMGTSNVIVTIIVTSEDGATSNTYTITVANS